ncbi:MAG TPA: DMT family transporter [Burkholderiales bacterium]|nr:DMT family transporter [Burkholderiales bacterium]
MTPFTAPVLALTAAACFGAALVIGQFGLRHAAPIAGATVSITFTLGVCLALSPFLLELDAWHIGALALFALVGVFYPAIVTLLTYESNRQLGPTLTGAVSCTAPLFAMAAAVAFLGEHLTWTLGAGAAVVIAGLMVLSTRAPLRTAPGWRLVLPLTGAALRGIAQMLTKLALGLWPSPFAAVLVGYATSAAFMWGIHAASDEQRLRVGTTGVLCFATVGALNGGALLLTYHALNTGSVVTVSPIVATYPLFTMLFSALFLRTETLGMRAIAGVLLAIAGVALILTA